MENFTLHDRILPLKVHINPRSRRMILRIERGGWGLRVSAPPGTKSDQITDFVEKCRSWIEQKLERIPPPCGNGPMLRDGVQIPYLGTAHRIIHCPGRGVTRLAEDTKQIIVTGEAVYLPRRLRDFFKQQARMIMTPLVFSYAARLGRKPAAICYKDTKSRWGSCSASGSLSFSWRIIMAPPLVVHYLVAHEVAHLVEMNHSQNFWQICTQLCPQTPQARHWLKHNGQTLHAINFARI